MKNKDDKILVSSLYLFYDTNKHRLIATTITNYPGIPFYITPSPKSMSERYAYQMYTTNNLYYIISNGGVELTPSQIEAINRVKNKIIGEDSMSRIENESTATLTREEIHSLVTEFNVHISRHQLELIKKTQSKYDECTI